MKSSEQIVNLDPVKSSLNSIAGKSKLEPIISFFFGCILTAQYVTNEGCVSWILTDESPCLLQRNLLSSHGPGMDQDMGSSHTLHRPYM
jgi:hypothetical protein